MNKPLFPAQRRFPSCFVPFPAEITLVPSPLVSASPANLRDGAEGGFGSLENQPRGPVEVGGCRTPGWVRGARGGWDKGLAKYTYGCSDEELGGGGERNVGPRERVGKLLLLLNSGEMRDVRQNAA